MEFNSNWIGLDCLFAWLLDVAYSFSCGGVLRNGNEIVMGQNFQFLKAPFDKDSGRISASTYFMASFYEVVCRFSRVGIRYRILFYDWLDRFFFVFVLWFKLVFLETRFWFFKRDKLCPWFSRFSFPILRKLPVSLMTHFRWAKRMMRGEVGWIWLGECRVDFTFVESPKIETNNSFWKWKETFILWQK